MIISSQTNSSSIQSTVSTNGVYYLVVIDDLGCISDTVSILINNIPSLTYDPKENESIFFPNPTGGVVYFKVYGDVKLDICNILGQTLISRNILSFEEDRFYSIDLSSFSDNIFFLYITSGDKIRCSKIFKN